MDKNLISKIQKLLSLATSDNEHEAKAAMDRANALLVKHNISMQQASEPLDYEKTVLDSSARASVEDKFVHDILKKFFFVKIVKSRSHGKSVYYVLGSETNVQIAAYVFGYLKHTFKALFAAYRKQTGCPANARQSYYFGLLEGIASQLEATKKAVEQTEGLVVVSDAALANFVSSHFPSLKRRTHNVKTSDGQAMAQGQADGKKVRISRGLSASSSQSNLYLK